MPIPKVYGDRIAIGSVGSRQVAALPASKAASPPIGLNRWARNGKSPSAQLVSALQEATNQSVLFRSKEVFRYAATFADAVGSAGAGDRSRWRFAFHTGPYTHALMVVVVMRPQDVSYDNNTYARLDLSTAVTGTPVALSQTFVHGSSPIGTGEARGWQYLKEVTSYVQGITKDTDYYGHFVDVDGARIQSATVYELSSMTQNLSGYLAQNLTGQSPILDVYRENVAVIQRALWKRGGAQVLNWTSGDCNATVTLGRFTGSTVSRNVINDSSTAVSAATPGYTLDMTGKNRLTQTTGVPVVMKAFGSITGGSGGRVYLRNSAGAAVLTLDPTWVNGAPAQWYSVSGVLPASLAKYDPHYDCKIGGATFTLRGVSVYEYDA